MTKEEKATISASLSIEFGKEIDHSLAEIVRALLKPATTEIGNLLGDSIGLFSDRIRLKRELNAKLGLEEVRRKLDAAKVEAIDITPPKEEELSLLVNGMSLSDDETIRDMWSGLFARALDPNSDVTAERPFISVLQSLSPLDAKIIDLLAFIDRTNRALRMGSKNFAPKDFGNVTPDEKEQIRRTRAFNLSLQNEAVQAILEKAERYGLNPPKHPGWPDNLLRQGIIKRPSNVKLSIARPAFRNLDERSLLRVIDHLEKKLKAIEDSTNRITSPPLSVFGHAGPSHPLQLHITLTDFGERLVHACGLV